MRRLPVLILCVLLLSGCAVSAEELPEAQLQEMVTVSDFIDRSEPPNLHVMAGNVSTQALSGTCTWAWEKAFGQWEGMCRDSMPALSCKELLEGMYAEEEQAILAFGTVPDRVTVQCWPDTQWDNPDAEPIQIPVNGQTITLRDGGYIYEVVAQWNETDDRGFYGTAYYCFYGILKK